MKKIFMTLMLCLSINTAHAEKLEDVSVLDISYTKDSFQVKMQESKDSKDSFFYVDIVKSDKDSFKKIALVLKKFKERDNFKLTLDIRSFSNSPSGSNYKSDNVTFKGVVENESITPL